MKRSTAPSNVKCKRVRFDSPSPVRARHAPAKVLDDLDSDDSDGSPSENGSERGDERDDEGDDEGESLGSQDTDVTLPLPSNKKGKKEIKQDKPPARSQINLLYGEKPEGGSNRRFKNWIAVLNNWSQPEYDSLVEKFEARCSFGIIGKEVGETGTPHLQCTFVVKNAMTFTAVKSMLQNGRIHLEVCRQVFNSIEYCKKDNKYETFGEPPKSKEEKGEASKRYWLETLNNAKAGTYELIDPKLQVVHAKTLEWIRNKHVMSNRPSDLTEFENVWIYGPSGCGKSRWVRNEFPVFYHKLLNKWWDNYPQDSSEVSVLIEDVDPDSCQWMSNYLKVWSDYYSFTAEVKGSSTTIRPKRVLVTSNYDIQSCFPRPQDHLPLIRRFLVLRMDENGKIHDESNRASVSTFNTPAVAGTSTTTPPNTPRLKRTIGLGTNFTGKRLQYDSDSDSDDGDRDDYELEEHATKDALEKALAERKKPSKD